MNEQFHEYRTGQTQPDKSSRGLIAFLLICVIFLCGVVSMLGMMNIKLLHMLRDDKETPLSFAEGDITPVAPEGNSLTVGGITVQELPDVYRQVQDLPAGLYVVDAPENGQVAPGDVLTEFDGTAVTTLDALSTLYAKKKAGDRLWFTFRRQGQAFSYTIPLGN